MGKFSTRCRSSRRAFGVAVAAAVGLSLAHAPGASLARAEAPALRWKFSVGEALHYQMDQKTVTEVKSANQNVKTTVTQTIDTTWNVRSIDDSGTADLTQTLDRLRTKIDSPFGAFEYDSNQKKAPEGPIAGGVVPMLKALVGAKFEYKMSPQGELRDVKIPEGLVKALKEAGPTANNVGTFSEDGLKNMILESSLILPTKDLDKSWTRQTKIPSPPIGTLVLDKTYKYEGPKDDVEVIGLDVTVKLDPDPKSTLDIKIGDQKGQGRFSFDNKAGRVVNSTVGERVEMLITVQNNKVTQSTDTSTTMKLVKTDAAASK